MHIWPSNCAGQMDRSSTTRRHKGLCACAPSPLDVSPHAGGRCVCSTPFFPDDGLDIPEDHAVVLGADALRPRVLAAHNAAMEGAAAARQQDGGGLRVSVAGDGADSPLADSSRDVSPSGRTSKKRAPQDLPCLQPPVHPLSVPADRHCTARTIRRPHA